MIPFDQAKWRDHFISVEGHENHLYLDGEGIVTIGIGCQVFEPSILPLLHKSDSLKASIVEITEEYRAVKACPAKKPPGFYDKLCTLYLPEADIVALFNNRLSAFIQSVEDSIVNLDDFPELAALVLIDMAFNLGVDGLKRKFPHFMNAFLAKDWKVAALECKREDIQKERNEWSRQSLESLIAFDL